MKGNSDTRKKRFFGWGMKGYWYMALNLVSYENDGNVISESMENTNDNGVCMSHMGFRTLDSVYCGKYLKTLTISGVATSPEYRRCGCVRQMLNKLFEMAPERGWEVSFLHPFSFSYYRKFGYEKVADHKIIEFPISKLDFTDRFPGLKPVDSEERAKDCTKIYNEFSMKRNIMFKRYGTSIYPTSAGGDKKTYIWYDAASKPASYITLRSEQYFSVNRMESVNLHIHEMAFTTPESLMALFGFIRMFEGEDKRVKIHNCAMSPEVDTVLKHYMHSSYTLVPDIAARILDVKAVLHANRYPAGERGCFTVKVEDSLEYTRGVYRVEYDNGQSEVTKLGDDAEYDLSASMPSFTQLVYGYDEYTADKAAYMDGVEICNPDSKFFNVFHKKHNGLFEHF